MSDRDIIKALAISVMQWPCEEKPIEGQIWLDMYPPDRAMEMWWPGCTGFDRTWNPLESIAGAYEMEAAILDSKYGRPYLLRLYDAVTEGKPIIGTTKLYRGLVRATPRQRCLAAIEAIGGGK